MTYRGQFVHSYIYTCAKCNHKLKIMYISGVRIPYCPHCSRPERWTKKGLKKWKRKVNSRFLFYKHNFKKEGL